MKKWEEKGERVEVDFKTTMVGGKKKEGVKVVGFEVLGLTFIYVIHFALFFSFPLHSLFIN